MNLTVRGVPVRLYRELKTRAELNRRSVSQETIAIIEQAVGPAPLKIEAILKEMAEIRARHRGSELTEEILSNAKHRGQPS